VDYHLQQTLMPSGYIVFCNTRSGNRRFYEWFNRYILFKFISHIHEATEWNVEDTTAYVRFDGEKIQLGCHLDNEYQSHFKEQNVYLGKIAASCTEIEQPCDRGNIFLGTKSKNRNLKDTDVIDDEFMNCMKLHTSSYIKT
jgi:hypothetical protein